MASIILYAKTPYTAEKGIPKFKIRYTIFGNPSGIILTTILFTTKTPTPPTIAMATDNLVLCKHWLQMH